MIRRSVFVLLLSLALAPALAEDTARTRLEAGNTAYEAGNWSDAESVYAELIASGHEDATVYYNLGCALARQGRHGEAMLALHRALWLAPRHDDAAANLAWLRARLADAPTLEPKLLKSLARAAALLPLRLGLALALGLEWLAALLVGAFLLTRQRGRHLPALRQLGILVALVALFVGLSPVLQLAARASEDTAVVLAPRTDARSGPAESNPVLFTMHEGFEIRALDERGGWLRVVTGDGLAGWIPAESAGRVRVSEER